MSARQDDPDYEANSSDKAEEEVDDDGSDDKYGGGGRRTTALVGARLTYRVLLEQQYVGGEELLRKQALCSHEPVMNS